MTLRGLAPFLLLITSCATVSESQLRELAHLPASAQATPSIGSVLDRIMGEKPNKCPRNGLVHVGAIDPASADKFAETLDACQGRSVVVEIDSTGGQPWAAIGMMKAIERHDHTVLCVVDGLAASSAFFLLQSCTSRYATNRSVLMMHTSLQATDRMHEQGLLNVAASLHALDEAMSAFCGKRMGLTMEQFYSHIAGDREWWLSMPEALKQHAIDSEAENVREILQLIGK